MTFPQNTREFPPSAIWSVSFVPAPIWDHTLANIYQNLLIQGAKEQSLPEFYQRRLVSQPTFKSLHTCRFRTGKLLFDSFWQPVARYIEKGVHRFKDERGNVPGWFLMAFDLLLWTMWFYHDYIHCVIWGRGDGLYHV